jgi:hypothetical protein
MMDARQLNDRVARGLGQAALRLGEGYEAFRPRGAVAPLARGNLLLRLNVALHGEDQNWQRSARYGDASWFAVHDTAYTRPGDYLRGPHGTFFIAAQPLLLPTVCILTNRILRFVRANGAQMAGANGYGGLERCDERLLLEGWPASVLNGSMSSHGSGDLPGEPGPQRWVVLLPVLQGPEAIELKTDDVMTDETGTSAVISAVERSELGWRLVATQAIT